MASRTDNIQVEYYSELIYCMAFAVLNLHNSCINCRDLIWRHLTKTWKEADE